MNNKYPSIQAFDKVARYRALRILLTGYFLMLMVSGWSMNGPVVKEPPEAGYTFILTQYVNNQIANGSDEDVLTFEVTDGSGNPVPGVVVSFKIGGTTVSTNLTSDASGLVTYSLAGGSVGSVNIIVTQGGNAVLASPYTFNFIAGPPDPTNSQTELIVTVPTSPPDGSTADVIEAQVEDASGNPIVGATVDFTVTGGSAAGTAVISPGLSVLTNASGIATIDITNLKSGTVTFTATVNGVSITNGSPATVNFVATTPSVTNPNTELIVLTPTSPPDGSTQDVVEAQVVDINGNPVPNATVVFTLTGGSAEGTAVTTPLTVATNANGDAILDITNTKAGTVTITATVNGQNIPNGSPATVNFVATTPSTTNPLTELLVNVNNSPPDGATADVVEAQVVDANGNPIANATVVFTIAGGSASGTAVTTTLTVTTNANGDAFVSVTNTKSGVVNFTATVNGMSITNGSPAAANFVATTPSTTNPATQLVVLVPTSPPDGATQDVVQAQIVDANGNPVPNATVVFKMTGGSAMGTAVTTTLTVTTDANGYANIDITNTKSGTVTLTATVNGQPITNGSPATVNFVATTPSTTNPATQLVVLVPTSPPDGTTQDVVQAQIVDASGNPVPNATVSFVVTGGSAAGTAVTTSLTVTTDANGYATVDITSTLSGTVTFTATVNGQPITNGSPATVNFVATTPSTTNPATQLIVDVPNAPDDGTTQTVIHAHIADVNGNPVNGATVVFTPTGGTAMGTAVISAITTDANGDYTIDITNTKPGTVIFTATVNGQPITNGSPATVTFITTPPSTTNPATQLVVDVPSTPADGTSQTVIHATVVDGSGNPLTGQTVVFTPSGGTAEGTAVISAVTDDGNGNYTITITNTASGTVTFTATVNGQPITNGSPATVTFVATAPSTTNPATQLIVDVPSAPDDGTTQTVIHAHIVDVNGNPVNGATVVFTPTGGTAMGTAVVSAITTDANGDYTIDITNTKPGTVIFTATVNGQPITNGSPATVTFITTPPSTTNPATQLVVDVPSAPADGTSQTVVHATVVDGSGNPLTGQTVVFIISGGSAQTTAVVSAVTDDGNGNYTIDITNPQSGTVSLTATVNGTPITNGSPATVTFTATTPDPGNAATQLIVDVPTAPDDGITQTVIHAHVVDNNGNPLPAATVVFTPNGGSAEGTAVISSVTYTGNGNYTIDVTNTAVGTVTFTATANGMPIINGSPATVTFTAGAPSTSNAATQLVVDITGSPADGATPDVIHAHIADGNGNAVSGATVVFNISGGSAQGTAVISSVTYTGNGNYSINITNTAVGTVILTATVNGTPITNNSPATVNFVAGAPSATGGKTQLTIIVNNNVANGTGTDSLQALITDANGNPVANTTVTFAIESGGTAGGTAVFAETATVTTNANGIATIGITNTVAGTVEVGALVGGTDITGSPAEVTFVNMPDVNNPATQLIVLVYEALADGTGSTVVKVHIVDQNGNPISDQSVVFSIDSGTAQITTPQPVMTDNNGDAVISLTSATAGYVLITATVDGVQIINGSPARVYFAPINIYVPRAFSPNADGVNDVLKPILVGIQTFQYFTVYNRWGNIVYQTTDPNQGWDGTFKGVPQPVETYLWIAQGVDTNGKTIVQKGMTSLVR